MKELTQTIDLSTPVVNNKVPRKEDTAYAFLLQTTPAFGGNDDGPGN